MTRVALILCLLFAAVGADRPKKKPCPAPPKDGEAPAYTEIEVGDGGKLTGTVTFKGEYEPKKWKVIKDRDFCGDSVADESLVADKDGGLRYVAVYFDDVKQGKALPKVVKEMANKDCLYQPHVETFSVCDKVMVTNHDPILHNTHAYIGDEIFEPAKPSVDDDGLLVLTEEDFTRGSGGTMTAITTLFNLGLPNQNFKPKKTLRKPGLITLKCDAGHTWMTGFMIVAPHPYHTVTAADGTYRIAEIPPGEYSVTFWHEMMGTQTKKLTIKAGETAKLDIEFELK